MVKRRRRGQPKTTETLIPVPSTNLVEKSTRQPRPPRARPAAIMVSNDKVQFPELLKAIRSKVDPRVTGDSITNMRRTLKGELLIEVSGGTEAMSTVKAEVERSLGPGATVKRLEDLSPVELRDLDEETTAEEVREAVSACCGGGSVKVASIRKMFGGAQAAIVLLPAATAKKLCTVGRLRVGLIYARVRPSELPTRCFKCHSFGHMARECSGADRGSRCWRCGEAGHFSRDCEAPRKKAAAYRAILTGQAGIFGNAATDDQTGLRSSAQEEEILPPRDD